MTRGRLPQRAGSLGLNGGWAAAAVPLRIFKTIRIDFNPLTPSVAIWVQGTPIKHVVPDRVKPSYAIFDIRAL